MGDVSGVGLMFLWGDPREAPAFREKLLHERYLMHCRLWADAIDVGDHEAAQEAARLAEMYYSLIRPRGGMEGS